MVMSGVCGTECRDGNGAGKPARLTSIDALRGFDMFYLAVGTTILTPLFTALGLGPGWERFFCSHPWEGFTLYDLIMPLFI